MPNKRPSSTFPISYGNMLDNTITCIHRLLRALRAILALRSPTNRARIATVRPRLGRHLANEPAADTIDNDYGGMIYTICIMPRPIICFAFVFLSKHHRKNMCVFLYNNTRMCVNLLTRNGHFTNDTLCETRTVFFKSIIFFFNKRTKTSCTIVQKTKKKVRRFN